MDLSKLFHDGILVEVHIGFWSGQKALTPEDLGLDPNTVSDAFVLGRKYLVDEALIREFRVRDSRARRVLDLAGFSFPIGGARFVPKARLEKVLAELEELKSEFLTLRDKLCENYAQYQQDMTPVYIEAAKVAFLNQEESVTEFSIDDREAKQAEYVKAFLARVETFYPSVAVLRNRFSLEWSIFEVGAPSLNKAQVANDVWKKAITDKVDAFVEDAVKTLRSEALEVVNRVHTSIVEGKVHGKTLGTLSDFIAKFKEMNFVGDAVVEEQLDALQSEVLANYPTEKIKESGEVQALLKARLVQIQEACRNIEDVKAVAGNYGRRVFVDDDEPAADAAKAA
jgi:hypothetical protein